MQSSFILPYILLAACWLPVGDMVLLEQQVGMFRQIRPYYELIKLEGRSITLLAFTFLPNTDVVIAD